MAVTVKDCHVCTSYFIKKYKERYKVEPTVNRNTARWSWANVLEGMSPQDVKELIDYYFTTTQAKRHSLEWFFYNYDKLMEGRAESEKDKARREKMRSESEQRAKEWRDRLGNQGITNN